MNIDILCLSETRLLGQNNLEIDVHILLWSGKEDTHQNVVAVLARKELLKWNRHTPQCQICFRPNYPTKPLH